MKRQYSQAQNKATQKYIKQNYERVALAFPKGRKETWKAAADAAGESLTAYIVKAVEDRIASENCQNIENSQSPEQ